MELIGFVIAGAELAWIGGVLDDFVEVDYAVEGAGGADEGVEGLAHGFGLVGGVAEGGEGAADDFDAVIVGAEDHLLHCADEVVGGDGRGVGGGSSGSGWAAGRVHVVNAFEDEEVLDARLGDDIAVEAGECADAGAVGENLVTGDALIDDGDFGGGGIGYEALGEDAGPTAVSVGRGGGAVGDGVAEGDDGGGFGGGLDVDAGDPVPGLKLFAFGEIGGGGNVTGLYPGGVEAECVGAGGAGVAGDVDADGQLGEWCEGESDGVADPLGSDGDGDGGLAVEGEGVVGGGDDGGVLVAERDVD